MKIKLYVMLLGLIGIIGINSKAQGTIFFQNLDFENGNFVPIPGDSYNQVQFSSAMPGWTGYLGTNQVDRLLHNDLFLSLAGIAIWGPDNPSADFLHGHYFLVLQNSFPVATDVPAIAQTGTIPVGTQSIRLYSNAPFSLGIQAFFAGNQIPLFRVGTASNGRPIWGGDISGFAGQTDELRFRGPGYLDFIEFSTEQVPEPSVLGLLGIGVFLFGRRLRTGRGS